MACKHRKPCNMGGALSHDKIEGVTKLALVMVTEIERRLYI